MDEEKARPLYFHWVANMFFAGLALGGGILFGERVPQDAVRLVPVMIPVIGALLIPLTRHWERAGMAKRAAAARSNRPGKPSGPGEPKARPTPKQRKSG